MKKTRGCLLLLLVSLTSCTIGGGNFSWSKYENTSTAMSLQSAKFKNYKMPSTTQDELDALMEKVEKTVVEKGSVGTFVRDYSSLSSKIYKLFDSYIIASTKYYANADQEYKEISDKLYSMFNSVLAYIYQLEYKIAESSDDIKEQYFGNMTDEEIQEYISQNDKRIKETEYTEELQNYLDEGQELYMQVNNGTLSVDEYMNTGYEYFLRYIDKANEFMEEIDQPSFFNYAYPEMYSRDYSINDAMKFVEYVKKYLVPVYKKKKSLATPNNIDRRLLDALRSYNFCNTNAGGGSLFQNYAEELGGSYLNAYNKMFKNGYYCFSNSLKSMSTAYQWSLAGSNDSVLYFSKNYQSILTVVHEFGHYYSSQVSGGARNNDAYDLLETYSQADEYTFLNFLCESKKDDALADTYRYFAEAEYYSQLQSIINDACITEIENFAFSTPDNTKYTLKAGCEDIIASYDDTASTTYFMVACITNPCYYISYATSVMEAMQFFDMSFEDAKTNYTELVESTKNMTMVERWENAGLNSPFEEETFKKLAESFETIAAKY